MITTVKNRLIFNPAKIGNNVFTPFFSDVGWLLEHNFFADGKIKLENYSGSRKIKTTVATRYITSVTVLNGYSSEGADRGTHTTNKT